MPFSIMYKNGFSNRFITTFLFSLLLPPDDFTIKVVQVHLVIHRESYKKKNKPSIKKKTIAKKNSWNWKIEKSISRKNFSSKTITSTIVVVFLFFSFLRGDAEIWQCSCLWRRDKMYVVKQILPLTPVTLNPKKKVENVKKTKKKSQISSPKRQHLLSLLWPDRIDFWKIPEIWSKTTAPEIDASLNCTVGNI